MNAKRALENYNNQDSQMCLYLIQVILGDKPMRQLKPLIEELLLKQHFSIRCPATTTGLLGISQSYRNTDILLEKLSDLIRKLYLNKGFFKMSLKRWVIGTGEKAQWLPTLNAVAKDLGRVYSTHMGTQNHLPLWFQGFWHPFLFSFSIRHVCDTHNYMQASHIHI